MIPRILHFIWLGHEPIPMRLREFRAGWERLHPGWEIRDWGEDIPWPYAPAPERCCHVRQSSNWMRLHALRSEGGVYVDFDTESLKNIEPLLDGRSACATPFHMSGPTAEKRVCNSFLAAEPEHPWIVECCERLKDADPAVHLSMGSSMVSAALARHPEVAMLDRDDILQRPFWSELRRAPDPRWYAIHHFDNMSRNRRERQKR
jgi:mannosyltransferase OCH1-like enzyme